MATLLTLGHGYSATAVAARLLPQGWTVLGTTRTAGTSGELAEQGVTPVAWPDEVPEALARATHVLSSVAPVDGADPVLERFGADIVTNAARYAWVGYLSTTGVYGDRGGDWVDETSPLAPATRRGEDRVTAETAWRALPLPLHIFRLAGIYGPGRGPFEKVRAGTARRIVKAGQVFSRIHVEDIAGVVAASIAHPSPGTTYNVCDDDPAPPGDVIGYAADLLGLPPPPEVAFEEADLSPMARSFYSESKRVSNARIRDELGYRLRYPTYREGLRAVLDAEAARTP